MTVLNNHILYVESIFAEVSEKAQTPESAVNADAFYDFCDEFKPRLATMETDVKDARRRIQLAKGPSKKKKAEADENASHGSGSAEED